jgi:hypothetical protein
MKRILYPKSTEAEAIRWDFPILEDTNAIVYTDPENIIGGRDPEAWLLGGLVTMKIDLLKQSEVALTFNGLYGVIILLDTEQSRMFHSLPTCRTETCSIRAGNRKHTEKNNAHNRLLFK